MTHPIHPSTARFIPRFATLAAALLPLAILPPLATAQTKPQADEAVVLEKMVIEDIPADQSILATRPSTSLYGFEEIIRETPRSVFQVTKAHLDNDTIQNYGDLSRYSPSVQRGTVSPFSVPKLRGGSGDTLRNNIVLFNTAVRPLNNNAWEAADIVAGIPSVIQGNTSRTAGYVNYVTKKPYFGENQTELTFRLGRLGRDAATSYSQFSAQLDHSTELVKDRLALRFSLLTANADLYWGNAEANSDDIFAALTWKPSSRLTVDLNFSYTRSDGLNSSGINRVTQDLIDNWNYVAGRYTPIITSSGTAYRLSADGTKWEYGAGYASSIPVGTGTWETAASVDTGTPIASNPTVGQLTGWYLHDANKRTVKVTGDQTYYANDGSNKSYEYIAQAITSYRINENFSLRNNTIYQYSDNSTHEYDVKWDIHSNKMFESRFEFITDNLFGGKIRHQSNSGFSFRYLDNFCDGLYNTNNAEGISTYADVTVPGSLGVSYALNGTPLSAILDKGPGSGT
ncbi:MAG: hypothetical protein LBC18_07195, partial [Opitutaceae bacterium]|nr:hypothetical protein [Opitutaceae bacterium]